MMEILNNISAVLAEAKSAAVDASNDMYDKIGGDRLACGFAWVDVYQYDGKKIRANSKLGKALSANGIEKSSYKGCFDLWNPSGLMVQNIDIKEAGAQAYASVLKKYGFTAYANSRLD
tara:strand:+ start:2386 stop:2739 length:354 start_codon:yes stop_codon:yes gene_type:complete